MLIDEPASEHCVMKYYYEALKTKFKTEEITNYMYNKIQWLFQPKIWLVIFPVQYKLLHLHFVLVRLVLFMEFI